MMEGEHPNDVKFVNPSSPSNNNEQEQEQHLNDGITEDAGGAEAGAGGIYVDPIRDVDIAPFLDCCCGYLPCCCCLYSYIPSITSAGDEDEYIDYDGGCFGGESSRPVAGALRIRNAFPVNKNVLLTLFISLLHGIADSLWNGTVLYAFLFIVYNGRNDYIGYMEALLGLSAVIFSFFPVGYMSEKWSKSGTIALGGFIFILGASLNWWLISWIGTDENEAISNSQKIFSFYLPLMLAWGYVSSVINGPALDLYTSSVHPEDHPSYFFVYFATYRIASTVGPLISIIIFEVMGNKWDLESLQVNLYVGMGLELAVGIFCFGYRDSWALEEEEEHSVEENNEGGEGGEGGETRAEEEEEGIETTTEGIEVERSSDNSDLSTPLLPSPEEELSCNLLCYTMHSRNVPHVLFISSLIMAAGGGMTIKFFPLYFKNDVDFKPSSIQGMYAIIPFTQVVLTEIMTSLSSTIGKVQTILLAKILGILFILLIGNGEDWLGNKAFILAPLFVFRSVLMNSTLPLEQSILMDFADDEQCRRWKWLDRFVSAVWAGSSALGGWLIDEHNYEYTFRITAYLQAGGVFFLFFLLPFVPRQKNMPMDDVDTGSVGSHTGQINSQSNVQFV